MNDSDLQRIERRLKVLFDAFENNTTRVVDGLHGDLDGLRQNIDRLSAWVPGEAPENPLELAAALASSHDDRLRLHQDMRIVWRWLAVLSILLIIERTVWSAAAWWWLRRWFQEKA